MNEGSRSQRGHKHCWYKGAGQDCVGQEFQRPAKSAQMLHRLLSAKLKCWARSAGTTSKLGQEAAGKADLSLVLGR